ncbi:myeloid leukemia factor isoform X2 [Drosophila miranda]|uniref:myeloid leukemia factor isoform X2 n=1 Tax=Drosophila miranda TaxID=7229 RepID=UPI0007E88B65|nr:myeloid leukemia factor isoform X2 [Drosophila miranda]
MSLFGALGLMGDFDDDLGLMNNHMNMNHTMNAMGMQMRSMNRLMNTFMPDPFMQGSPFDPGFQQGGPHQMAAMPAMGMFGMPMMPNFNRLLNADIGANPGASFCQSTVMTMSSGPDGRPQIYQASTSTKTGPGGVRETRKTVQDSRTGVKKMAIGHHIGERAHIIEKEQDMRSGQLEERQEFINLDEEEAEQFDREFTTRAHRGGGPHGRHGGMQAIRAPPPAASTSTLTIEPVEDDDDDDDCVIQEQQPQGRSSAGRQLPTLPAPSTAPHGSRNATAAATTTTTESSSPTVHDPSNNNYVSIGNSRRAYMRNGQHLATPRRPLRTPASSPLATISSGSHSIAATPSKHPHPYAAHPRRQQRPMKNSHHHHTKNGGESSSAKSGKRAKK